MRKKKKEGRRYGLYRNGAKYIVELGIDQEADR